MGGSSDVYDFASSYRTRLEVFIPTPAGESQISIVATDYPDLTNPDSLQKIYYNITPNDLDEIIEVRASNAIRKSKTMIIDPKSVDGYLKDPKFIPAEYGTLPPDRLLAYQQLFGSLEQRGAKFEGSTPPKRILRNNL